MWSGLQVFQRTALRCEVLNRPARRGRGAPAPRTESPPFRGRAAPGLPRHRCRAGSQRRRAARTARRRTPPNRSCRPRQLVGDALGLDLRAPADLPPEVEFHDRVSLDRVGVGRQGAAGDAARRLVADRRRAAPRPPRRTRAAGGADSRRHRPPTICTIRRPANRRAWTRRWPRSCRRSPISSTGGCPMVRSRCARCMRFGARGVRADLRMLLLTAVALGLFGTVTPYLTGRIFDAAIPQSDRGDAARLRHSPSPASPSASGGVQAGAGHCLDPAAGAHGGGDPDGGLGSAAAAAGELLPHLLGRRPRRSRGRRRRDPDADRQRRRRRGARRDQRPVLRRADAHLSPRRWPGSASC